MIPVSTITLAGCGKMGMALLKGWRQFFPDTSVHVLDPQARDPLLETDSKITLYRDAPALAASESPPAVLVLAVKPQTMDDACRDLAHWVSPDTLVISIAAGMSAASIARHLGREGQPVIRTMPNLPASIGFGATAGFAGPNVTDAHRAAAEGLLKAVGEFFWVDAEELMDAVTALSGSGPAYVFLLAEAMADAGAELGLPRALATSLARATLTGSAKLMDAEAATPVSTLRQNVTSPGGTTAAALDVLMKHDDFKRLMKKAIEAARDRGRALNR